ncbi:hypothetical protein [Trinickia soli]|uniref:Alpha/beta hydrolase n=1 Tax=Trinickia soli TaxID=380675 RepID=A0A2N7VJG6_9BURK|nr:hypothetical protein [Trinickia soli]PMS17306.1 hypothetical protein C0Z19_24450 [Trinickia soli]CAB3725382.1 hypothetical protein LMG24076_05012 [Trinickia soli]
MTDTSRQFHQPFPGTLPLAHSFDFEGQSVRYGVIGSGHLMQEDAPEAIVGEMMDFMLLGGRH